jgi:hypothetical protein
MYLIHGPIILYVLKPLAGTFLETSVGPLALLPMAGIFILLMYAMAEGITRLADILTPASLRSLPVR